MEGLIVSFRRGRTTQYGNQMILKVDGSNSIEDAEKFVGKKVIWTTPSGKKIISGVITSSHGNKGALKARFERGMPGQSLCTKIKID